MGFLNQLLLAALIGDYFGRQHFGHKAMLFGASFCLLIDIPVFFSDSLDLYSQEHAHSWNHSIFGILLYTLIILGLSFLRKKDILPPIRIILPIFIVHLIFDASTTNGAPLFYPFSNTLIGWNALSRFDPILFGILSISVLLLYRVPHQFKSRYPLFLLSCYSLFSYGLTLQAKTSVAPLLTQMGFPKNQIHITTPYLLFPLRRVSVRDQNARFAVSYYSPFSARPPRIFVRQSLQNPQIESLVQSDIGQRLLQISSSMIFIDRINNRYIFSDIRFGGFHDLWESPIRVQSIIEKGSALPLEHVHVYSKTPFFEEIQNGWQFIFP